MAEYRCKNERRAQAAASLLSLRERAANGARIIVDIARLAGENCASPRANETAKNARRRRDSLLKKQTASDYENAGNYERGKCDG